MERPTHVPGSALRVELACLRYGVGIQQNDRLEFGIEFSDALAVGDYKLLGRNRPIRQLELKVRNRMHNDVLRLLTFVMLGAKQNKKKQTTKKKNDESGAGRRPGHASN